MADAKKCDRCGKYYDKNDRKLWLYNSRGMRYEKPFDLCPGCETELEQWFNKNMGDISDGYHTFNELYHHRAVLFANICNKSGKSWKSKKHHDGSMYDGMFIVGINTPDGQATYHYDIDPYWDLFHCTEYEFAPEWDGHTPDQAIERLKSLAEDNE